MADKRGIKDMKMSDGQIEAYLKLCRNPIKQYGYFNFTNLFGVANKRRQAIEKACEVNHGKPWKETRKLFQIHKIEIKVL